MPTDPGTYHVYDTPQVEHFVKIEDAEHIAATFKIGEKLKANGVLIKYAHAPMGMWEGQFWSVIETDPDEYTGFRMDGTVLYLLFQQLPDGVLKYAEVPLC